MKPIKTSGKDSNLWKTPTAVKEGIMFRYGLDLDPLEYPIKTNFFDIPGERLQGKGLFINPPYSRGQIEKFISRCEYLCNYDVVSVLLLPSRTGTAWFHHLLSRRAEVEFIRGRIKFEKNGSVTNAPFDSIIVVIE